MTIEEKAKAYDNLIERLKDFQFEYRFSAFSDTIERYFPELKESEDERIRKWIIDDIKYNINNEPLNNSEYKKKAEKAIAWLEKQRSQNLANSAKTCKDEQMPADKVEPKFKAGDVMRTIQEVADGIKDGLPVVVSIDDEYYRCTNELIAIKDQDDYEYPPINKQKPAWSEEDERMFNSALWHIKNSCGNGGKNSGEFEVYHWLKSLKDKVPPQWKPSDEQMDALETATSSLQSTALESLYNELKKL